MAHLRIMEYFGFSQPAIPRLVASRCKEQGSQLTDDDHPLFKQDSIPFGKLT